MKVEMKTPYETYPLQGTHACDGWTPTNNVVQIAQAKASVKECEEKLAQAQKNLQSLKILND
jgi:hypothetical protein